MIAAVFLFVGVAVPLAVHFNRPLHPDEMAFLVIGQQLADGATLYAGIADHKLPAIYYLAEGIAVVSSQLNVLPHVLARPLVYLVQLSTATLVVILGTRFRTRLIGICAGLLFLVGVNLYQYEGYVFITEPFAVFFLTAATVALFREGRKWDVVAGVALGLGALFNQSVLLAGIPVIGWLIFTYLKHRSNTVEAVNKTIKQTVAIGTGFVLPIALTVGFFWQQGALSEFLFYTFELPIFHYEGRPYFLNGQLLSYASYLPVWLLAFGVVCTIGRDVLKSRTANKQAIFLSLWLIVLAYPAVTSFHGSHRFQFIMVPGVLLATTGLWWLYDADVVKRMPTSRQEWTSLGFGVGSGLAFVAVGWALLFVFVELNTVDPNLLLFVPCLAVLAIAWVGTIVSNHTAQLNPGSRQRWAGAGAVVLAIVLIVGLTAGVNILLVGITAGDHIDQQASLAAEVNGHTEGEVYSIEPPTTLEFAYFGEADPVDSWVTTVYADPLAERVITTLERDEVPYVVVWQPQIENGQIDPDHGYYDAIRPVITYVEANYEPVEQTENFVIYQRQ